jgi:hypothetical protein
MSREVSGSPRQPVRRWVIKVAWVGVPLVVLGESGHLLLSWAREQLAHHFFHIVFGIGAGVIFFAFVIRDIRRHGRPSFSWRLHPETPRSPDAPA